MVMQKDILDKSLRQLFRDFQKKLIGQTHLQDFDDVHPCVFVLSTGRSGTETMASLLSLAKNVYAYHEPTPKLYSLSKLAYELFGQEQYQKVLQESFLLARKDLLDYSLSSGKGYVETSPQVTFLAPIILRVIPRVRFIHLARDPREVVRSGMRRKWFAGNPADKTRITPLTSTVALQNWDSFNPFQKNLWLWSETNRWIMEFCSTISSQSITLRSEDVFSFAPETLKKLFGFVGASMPFTRGVMDVLGKKLNAQRSGDFPEASTWTDEMNRDLITIAGATATSLGYQLV